MAFREVGMHEVKGVLRLWLAGRSLRAIAQMADVDRKTFRRYGEGAIDAGLVAGSGEEQLSDEFLGAVVERIRPMRTNGRGAAWRQLEPYAEQFRTWLDAHKLTEPPHGPQETPPDSDRRQGH